MTEFAENANIPSPSTKTCSSCYETKPTDQFYRSAVNVDGYYGICKDCQKEKATNNRKNKNLLSYEQVAQHKKFWLPDNRLKRKAHQAVGYAIASKKMIRQPCEKCGTNENVVAHHEDYTKPLDVVWLCKKHHRERHLEIDKENKDKPKPDMVNNPPHYTHGGIETIAYIRAKLSPEEYVGYLRGNIEKYNSRIGLKGESSLDAGKIKWYAIELDRFLNEG